MDLDAELDRLFRLPLGEFVAARNQLAKDAKAIDKDRAAAIKKMPKPSVPAWAVNQIWFAAGDTCQALAAAGDRLLGLQTGGDRAALAEATATKRRLLTELTRLGESILAESGHGTSAATVRKVQATLDALGTYGSRPPEPGWGRLCKEVPPPGLAELAALASGVPVAVVETESETGTETETETEAESETESEAETESETEAESETESEAETGAETESESEAEAEVEPEPDLTPLHDALDDALAVQREAHTEAAEALIELERLDRQLAEARARAERAHQVVNEAASAVAAARRALREAGVLGDEEE